MMLTLNKEKRTMRRRLTIWILALTLVGAFSLIGCDKKEEAGVEQVKQDVSEMAEEGAKATEQGAQAVGEKVEEAAETVGEKAEEAAEAVKGEHK